MNGTARIWKPLGKTPLEAAEAWREKEGLAKDVPIAYAGRLDPMAEGVLLLLLGDECKKLPEYRDLDKEYEVEVLFGVSTDTGDLLGLVKASAYSHKASFEKVLGSALNTASTRLFSQELCSNLQGLLQQFVGTHEWEYPVFSSKTVEGKPLFRWFYEGRIGEIVIPKRKMTIHSVEVLGCQHMTHKELATQVKTRIATVTKVEDTSKEWGNDFRRVDVLARWDEVLQSSDARDADFCIAKIRVACSSGTYMRTLAEKIGEALHLPACAFSIVRTRVGDVCGVDVHNH